MSHLKKLPLHGIHLQNNAIMSAYAGWTMPLYYRSAGIVESNLHTRKEASLFDVSHMYQTRIYGKDRVKFTESMVVSDLEELPQYKAQLTCFINTETAGILDDCIIQKFPDHIWLVNNAINAKKISSLMKEKCINLPSSYDVSIDFESTGEGQGSCLIAIQGPRSEEAIRCIQNGETTRSLQNLSFGSGCPIHLLGEECYISRTGYTGEDGFELCLPTKHGKHLEITETLLKRASFLRLAGLATRDTLRIEAGFNLYGHEISEDTNPMEANMKWTIGKRFLEKKDTFASKTLATLFKDTSLIKAKLVGLEILEGPPARGGESIISKEGIEFGSVTSGTYSPTLGKFIAIARVQKDKMFGSIIGQKVSVVIRDQQYEATICKLPFITHTYTK